MEVDEDSLFPYKVVLLGESSVGKSSLVSRFCQDQFQENAKSTIAAAFFQRFLKLQINGIEKVAKLGTVVPFLTESEIWDTAGQEKFRALAPMYYRESNGAIVVYDCTNMESYLKVKSWVKELQRASQGSEMVIAIVGNKKDMDKIKKVNDDMASFYAKENDLLFFEASAKTGENVQVIFEELAKKMLAVFKDNHKMDDIIETKERLLPPPDTNSGCKC